MTDEGFPFILPPDDEPPKAGINFQAENIDFEIPFPGETIQWIKRIISLENCRLSFLNYIFCSDSYLHQINLEYLNHDTLTDIITFPYAAPPEIAGDIFISIDRIRENADHLQVNFTDELHRVMIHGILHLCGYGDKTPAQKKEMTAKEEEALRLFIQP